MGLLERLGLSSQIPTTEEEKRVERVKVLEQEARAARELPIPELARLSCGHRSQRPLRPGQPQPPRGMCPLCVAEAEQARQGGKQPFVLASVDQEIHVDATRGVLDPRDIRRQPAGWAEKHDRWLEERRKSGEILSNSEQEQAALRRIEELRREEEEAERIRAMSSEERASLAASNFRKRHGIRGGAYGRYRPSPAKAGR
jgi:hypothetical protein